MTARTLDRSRFSRRGGTPKHVYENAGSGYFYTARKEEYNLTNVRILSNVVDTVRQLYEGVPDSKLIEALQVAYESQFQPEVEFFSYAWILSGGSGGGFKYMLRNNDLGLIVHLINRHVKAVDSETPYDFPDSTHLKIECSPHFLFSHSIGEVQAFLNDIAHDVFIGGWEHVGCAVHLAVDIAGIGDHIPENFRDRFITLSTLRSQYSGIESLDHATNMVQYGYEKSILFGKPDRTQFNMYNKTEEAIAKDKLDFWQNIWLQRKDQHGQPIYQLGEPVMRVEYRLHHSVIREFAPASALDYAQNDSIPLCDSLTGEIVSIGTVKEYGFNGRVYQHADIDLTNATEFRILTSYLEISKYLDSLWHYCLKRFRLHLKPKSTYVDPLWTVLKDDISWDTQPILFKRTYSKRTEGVEKNIGLFIGNGITLAARMGAQLGINRMVAQLFKFLRKSIFWKDIFFHYFKKVYYSEYAAYKKKMMLSGFMKDPRDWASYIDKSTFDQVLCYIRDEVIGVGVRKRFLIGKAAV